MSWVKAVKYAGLPVVTSQTINRAETSTAASHRALGLAATLSNA